jgi:CRISPR-associated endoribonuclease Cas6
MPYTFSFALLAEETTGLPDYPGRALHGLFYQWLALGDYDLATEVHDNNGSRPFTVGLLSGSNGQARLRFTVLDDDLWPALKQGMAKTPTVEILNQPLTLPQSGPAVYEQSYPDLVANVHSDRHIGLRFHSPTSFHSGGMHVPLPEPRLLFQSWLLRWNDFAPEDHQINIALLDIVEAHVAVSRYTLRTRMVDWGRNRKVVGFVGEARFYVLRAHKIGEEWLRKLNILADYAPFCGTGHKTTQGLGLTERIR